MLFGVLLDCIIPRKYDDFSHLLIKSWILILPPCWGHEAHASFLNASVICIIPEIPRTFACFFPQMWCKLAKGQYFELCLSEDSLLCFISRCTKARCSCRYSRMVQNLIEDHPVGNQLLLPRGFQGVCVYFAGMPPRRFASCCSFGIKHWCAKCKTISGWSSFSLLLKAWLLAKEGKDLFLWWQRWEYSSI